MLLLARNIGEQILIDKGLIIIKILNVTNLDIVLEIKAPADMEIKFEDVVLTKNDNQRIEITSQIGKEILLNEGLIKIKHLFIGERKAVLGIHAPSHMDVDRKEIFLFKRAKEKMNIVAQSN
jgi:carbon storage regulator